MTAQEILTVLIDPFIDSIARFGCGLAGLPYPDQPDPP